MCAIKPLTCAVHEARNSTLGVMMISRIPLIFYSILHFNEALKFLFVLMYKLLAQSPILLEI